MFVKAIAVSVLLASTPIAWVASQDPRPDAGKPEASAMQRLQQEQRQTTSELTRARQELDSARAELQQMKQQLGHALDALDKNFEPQRDRNCSPTRNRALLSHYQWLRDEGHAERAAGALAKVVEQVGDDQNQRNSVAHDLMTNKETVGKCDDVALAIAMKMEQAGATSHHQLDTMALAHFLNGRFEKAIELEPDRLRGEVERICADPHYRSHSHRHQAYVTRGQYVEQLERLLKVYPREQLLIVESERFFEQPEVEFERILRFLDLPVIMPAAFDRYNARPRSPMAESIHAGLRSHFETYDEGLAQLLGHDPAWRR